MADSVKRFPEVSGDINFPRDEQRILAFWKEQRIFERSLEARKGSPEGSFVFYEGPPTANGVPHNGHVLTRVMKDLFPRYRTMRGQYVPRKAGWDTHGLPVEVEVEKELRIHGKAAIEQYGVEPFTARCIESVFRYTTDWERITERIGFWVDLDAYVTYHRSYVESVWWALSELFKKGLLYRGHKVVWWWAQGGTALSAGEVGQGYKTIDDPSVFVAFPIVGDADGRALVVWTTTPWTLPSNSYAAVHPEHTYAFATLGDRRVVMAEALVAALAKKLGVEARVERVVKGSELVGLAYQPPFDIYETLRAATPYFRVIAADFVTLDTGTGIVHVAPAFGEDDFAAHRKLLSTMERPEEVPLLCAVKPDGTFSQDLPRYAGRFVKEADDDIARELKERGLLLLKEQYRHEYPFCWRADDDPLIQYARPTWYIRTTSKKAEAIANNRAIDWHPEHIKEGRFGDFLANNVDWALSRERFWGTPLPVWQNAALPEAHPDHYVVISGLEELRAQPGCNLAEVEAELGRAMPDAESRKHLLVHKPWIDRVTFRRPGVEGTYRRVTEVIDCWFDAGSMPFAQWGFPHVPGSLARFREAFPADFISEAIDQTRGWFYTLLMISTLLFDEQRQAELGLAAGKNLPHPYKTCLLLGHVSDKEGKKESKQKGNYTPPEVILDRVRMEFAVVDEAALASPKFKGAKGESGKALIAREDLEGLDLQDGARVSLYLAGAPDRAAAFEVRALKGLPRRVVLLTAHDREALGAAVGPKGVDVRPVEVPGLGPLERVYLEDPSTPAPGADAFRWFFYAASPPWTNTRHSLSNVRTLQRDFLVKLRNVFSFFTIYANIDGFDPAARAAEPAHRPLLDRWILSELALLTRGVRAELDRYNVFEAAQRLTGFVEALSNWYVRRSRERFWVSGAGEAMGDDKRAAYATLYGCLRTMALLSAPFIPFFAEELYQSLVVKAGAPGARASVHLEDYPLEDASAIDEALVEEMGAVRELVSLGLQVRTAAKLKVRQPLRRADLVLSRPEMTERLRPHFSLIREELNVHEVRLLAAGQEGKEVAYRLKPNFRVMGPKVGKKVQRVKQELEKADAGKMRALLVTDGKVPLEIDGETIVLTSEDVEIAVEAAAGFAAAGGRAGVVVLKTELDQQLLDEGLGREIQSKLQSMRKELGLGFTDRVLVAIDGNERVARIVEGARAELSANVLIERLEIGAASFVAEAAAATELEAEAVRIAIARA